MVTDSVERATTYKLRLIARNAWGWGAYSAETSIKAANAPLIMDTLVTSVSSTDGGFVITWTEPDTYGDPITSYVIEIQDKAASTWITGACDGSDPTTRTCTVDMLTLG
jgi:hypothetical protein